MPAQKTVRKPFTRDPKKKYMYIIKRTKKRYKQAYCYSVINTRTKRVFSKCATKKNAEKQLGILYTVMRKKKVKNAEINQ